MGWILYLSNCLRSKSHHPEVPTKDQNGKVCFVCINISYFSSVFFPRTWSLRHFTREKAAMAPWSVLPPQQRTRRRFQQPLRSAGALILSPQSRTIISHLPTGVLVNGALPQVTENILLNIDCFSTCWKYANSKGLSLLKLWNMEEIAGPAI